MRPTVGAGLFIFHLVASASIETYYRQVNQLPGSKLDQEMKGLGIPLEHRQDNVFFKIRAANLSGTATLPNATAVVQELTECLEPSNGQLTDFQFRCAKIIDPKAELRVAYGTSRDETMTESLCWQEPEHLGMLVCSTCGMSHLFINDT